jgi:dTDP-4-amino-4,6-dideoxygalactose transaminase
MGAKPVFVDIDPVTYNMDPVKARRTGERSGRIKAILPVHLFGQCAAMEKFEEMAKEWGAALIEDAAQAIGAEDARGRRAGSIGQMGCLSFFPTKNLGGFGDGGMVTAKDAKTAGRLRMLRVHGSKERYRHELIGFNARLDALQAAVLRVKLNYLDAWTAGRQSNARLYDEAFKGAGAMDSAVPLAGGGLPIRTPHHGPAGSRHVFNQYVIRVPGGQRDRLRAYLAERKIGTEVYYPIPLHRQVCFEGLGLGVGSLEESERAAEETIALPIFPELTSEQIGHVAEAIIGFFG